MSKQAYHQIMKEFGPFILPSWHPYTQFVRKVADNLIRGEIVKNRLTLK
jgi:hypothetical protein